MKDEVYNPGTYRVDGWMPPPLRFFLIFSLDDQTSAPDVFSSCSFITRAHFETSLVMISFYGYETWTHKSAGGQAFFEWKCNFFQR